MENNVVLAYEMHQPGLGILPPLLPALGQKLLGIGNIADRSVEPHVQYLPLGPFYRNGHAPVKVTCNGTGHEAAVQPAFALAVNVGLPLLVLLQDPVPQPGLVLVQRQIPVLGLALHRLGTAHARLGLQKLFRAKRAAAFLALVAISMRIAALGAYTLNQTVREEHFGLLVVQLLAFLADEIVLVVQLAEKLRCILSMYGR